MAAPRVGPAGVEEAYAPGFLDVADVVDAHPRPGLARLLRLVGDQHCVAHDGERVGAQVRVVEVRLDDDLGVGDVRDVDAGDVLGALSWAK